MVRVTEFDPSAFLDDDEVVAEYLTAALEDENPDVFLAAVGNVAKARGMSVIAERAGLGRESLYKALASGAKPRYDTVLKVLQSLGVKLWCLRHNYALHRSHTRPSRRLRCASAARRRGAPVSSDVRRMTRQLELARSLWRWIRCYIQMITDRTPDPTARRGVPP